MGGMLEEYEENTGHCAAAPGRGVL
jgi:hypothetical protein